MKTLPYYKCSKIVRAAKVVAFVSPADPDKPEADWKLDTGCVIEVSAELAHRGGDNPIGGYFVLYEDGFQSWSPAEAFEKGYSLIQDGLPEL